MYRSKAEAPASLWNEENGRPISISNVSMETLHMISHVVRLENRDTRAGRHERDSIAVIRDVWDKWVEILPLLYTPGPHITVSNSTCPTSLSSMASKHGQPVMQNPAMLGICRYTLESYLEKHMRR